MRDRVKVQWLVGIGTACICIGFFLFFFQPVGIVEINPEDINYVLIGFEFGLTGIGILLLILAWMLNSGILKDGPVRSFRAPAYSEEEREKAEERYKERVESALNVALKKQKDLTSNEIVTAVEFTNAQREDFCMICKLQFKNKDTILQCPVCESLYHKEHLIEWIRVHKNCPVCSQKLYETVE